MSRLIAPVLSLLLLAARAVRDAIFPGGLKRHSSRLVLFGLCAAGVLAVSAAGLVFSSSPNAVARVKEAAIIVLAPPERSAGTEKRCEYCGWIESMREIRPGVADPLGAAVYEYTVRRADGSGGVFQEERSAAWGVGKRLVFIGGADAVP